MNSQHGASDGASSSVIRAADRGIADSPNILGRFHLKHIRNGEVLHDEICYNTITNEGLTHLFAVGLLNGKKHPGETSASETLETVWYMGLITNDNAGAAMSFASTLTHASLANALSTEFQNYSGTRQDWTGKAAIHSGLRGVTNAAGSAITGASGVDQATFTITDPGGDVGGIFIASDSTKGSVVGTERLFAIAPTSTPNISVTANDQILVSYTATIGQ